MVPAEIWLSQAWRDAVIARGKPFKNAAQNSFSVAHSTLGVQPSILSVNNRVAAQV